MNGWMGKILRVDLTSGACSARPMEPSVAKDYIGGRGLGAKLYYDLISPDADPLGLGQTQRHARVHPPVLDDRSPGTVQ